MGVRETLFFLCFFIGRKRYVLPVTHLFVVYCLRVCWPIDDPDAGLCACILRLYLWVRIDPTLPGNVRTDKIRDICGFIIKFLQGGDNVRVLFLFESNSEGFVSLCQEVFLILAVLLFTVSEPFVVVFFAMMILLIVAVLLHNIL